MTDEEFHETADKIIDILPDTMDGEEVINLTTYILLTFFSKRVALEALPYILDCITEQPDTPPRPH